MVACRVGHLTVEPDEYLVQTSVHGHVAKRASLAVGQHLFRAVISGDYNEAAVLSVVEHMQMTEPRFHGLQSSLHLLQVLYLRRSRCA